ncbi:MAG: glucokinase [Vicinamibacterales bacterium]
MWLAADVGGTKTLLGLFDDRAGRLHASVVREYATTDFTTFPAMLDRFAGDTGPLRVRGAAMGVAGPVLDNQALLTNVGWAVDGAEVATHLGLPRVLVLNDLAAIATSVGSLDESELVTLHEGQPDANGGAAVIAAGTGLGVALLQRGERYLIPAATESGHADFAARSDDELTLVRQIRYRFGRATVEHVLSGQGFVHLHRLTHGDRPCAAVHDLESEDAPAQISGAGLDGTCASCTRALEMFVEAYGAEAGNLALRSLPRGGVYVGGGIAPKILPALQDGRFMRAFLDKAPMEDLVARIPVYVILNQRAGLLGAAVAASRL